MKVGFLIRSLDSRAGNLCLFELEETNNYKQSVFEPAGGDPLVGILTQRSLFWCIGRCLLVAGMYYCASKETTVVRSLGCVCQESFHRLD